MSRTGVWVTWSLMATLWALAAGPVRAQALPTPVLPDSLMHPRHEDWMPFFEHEGVQFSYLHYGYQIEGALSSSVVVKLVNTNPHAVQYAFKMLFRSADETLVVAPVDGTLEPGQVKTGDHEGLYWMPFSPGVDIAEVGLRGYRVEPLRAGASEPPPSP